MSVLPEAERKRRASARDRAHYAANREAIKAQVRAYQIAHADERRAYYRKYQIANRTERLAYQRSYYAAHIDKARAHAAADRARARAWIAAAKAGGCVDCGIKDLRVLDFDHVRGRKLYAMTNLRSIAKLEAEVAKCEVRCANCHRIQTVERRMARAS